MPWLRPAWASAAALALAVLSAFPGLCRAVRLSYAEGYAAMLDGSAETFVEQGTAPSDEGTHEDYGVGQKGAEQAHRSNAGSNAELEGGSKSMLVLLNVQYCFMKGGDGYEPGYMKVVEPHKIAKKLVELIDRNVKTVPASDRFWSHIGTLVDHHPLQHISFSTSWGAPPTTIMPLKCKTTAAHDLAHTKCCWATPGVPLSTLDGKTVNPTTIGESPSAKAWVAKHGDPERCTCKAGEPDCVDVRQYEQTLWPNHCDNHKGTNDQDVAKEVARALARAEPKTTVFISGEHPDVTTSSMFFDKPRLVHSDHASRLLGMGVNMLFFTGMPTEFSVFRTVSDAVTLGFKVVIIWDATAGVAAKGMWTKEKHGTKMSPATPDIPAMPHVGYMAAYEKIRSIADTGKYGAGRLKIMHTTEVLSHPCAAAIWGNECAPSGPSKEEASPPVLARRPSSDPAKVKNGRLRPPRAAKHRQ